MIRYAGIALLQPDADGELMRHLRAVQLEPLGLFAPHAPADSWLRTTPVGRAQPQTPLPRPNYPAAPPLTINQLSWPTGATRWSTFVGLVTWTELQRIVSQFPPSANFGGGRNMSGRQLEIGDDEIIQALDPDGYTTEAERLGLSTEMFLLEPRPVVTFTGTDRDGDTYASTEESLWLLPMVDVRYWWQYVSVPQRVDLTNSGQKTAVTDATKETWSGWLGLLSAALNFTPLTLAPADIASAYVAPDRHEFDQLKESVPVVLDALAHSLGRRFVRRINGDCIIQGPTNAVIVHGSGNVAIQENRAGGMAIVVEQALPPDFSKSATAPYDKRTIVPEFVDVVFRKLVEWEDPADEPDLPDSASGDNPPGQWATPIGATSVLIGSRTRTIRTSLPLRFGAKAIVLRAHKTIYCTSWVGRLLFEEDGSVEPPGSVDDTFYGDRYFRLAEQIARDWFGWQQQRHEYQLNGLHKWYATGFDDAIIWDAKTNTTHVCGMPHNFGSDTQLVQSHRQCDFRPDRFVGMISGKWKLFACEDRVDAPPAITNEYNALLCTTSIDAFASSWKYMTAPVRPFIPCDPWAAESSIEYKRAFVLLGEVVTVTNRDERLVKLLEAVVNCDGEACLDDAKGVVEVFRVGCEWRTTFGGGGSGASIVHFTITACECDPTDTHGHRVATATVTFVACGLSDPAVGDEILVYDLMGCWLTDAAPMLIGRKGIAFKVEHEVGYDICTWSILALCASGINC